MSSASETNSGALNDVRFHAPIPVFRIFSISKGTEFYVDYLGFQITFEHRFKSDGEHAGPQMPLYMGIKRDTIQIHLTEHHGDACPGSTVFVPMTNIAAFRAELQRKKYGYMRPGLEEAPWGITMEVVDPFGNRIRFCERHG